MNKKSDKTRAAFEKWHKENYPHCSLNRTLYGRYENLVAKHGWSTWKAATDAKAKK